MDKNAKKRACKGASTPASEPIQPLLLRSRHQIKGRGEGQRNQGKGDFCTKTRKGEKNPLNAKIEGRPGIKQGHSMHGVW